MSRSSLRLVVVASLAVASACGHQTTPTATPSLTTAVLSAEVDPTVVAGAPDSAATSLDGPCPTLTPGRGGVVRYACADSGDPGHPLAVPVDVSTVGPTPVEYRTPLAEAIAKMPMRVTLPTSLPIPDDVQFWSDERATGVVVRCPSSGVGLLIVTFHADVSVSAADADREMAAGSFADEHLIELSDGTRGTVASDDAHISLMYWVPGQGFVQLLGDLGPTSERTLTTYAEEMRAA